MFQKLLSMVPNTIELMFPLTNKITKKQMKSDFKSFDRLCKDIKHTESKTKHRNINPIKSYASNPFLRTLGLSGPLLEIKLYVIP